MPLESVKQLEAQKRSRPELNPFPTMKGETDFHTKTVASVWLQTQNEIK